MEETKIRRIAVVFFLLLITSLVAHFWQIHNHTNATMGYRETVATLTETSATRESEIENHLAYILYLEEKRAPDVLLQEQQRDTIHRFISSYFTFSAGEEEARIENVADLVADEMLNLMRETLAEAHGGNYHLSLSASNINIYSGSTNEFIATFNVAYESDITRPMTQILVMRFTMTDEQISDFVIVSASEVFDFD